MKRRKRRRPGEPLWGDVPEELLLDLYTEWRKGRSPGNVVLMAKARWRRDIAWSHLLAEWRARGLRYESGYYHPGVARAIPEKVREIMRETGATRPAVYSALVLTADWDKVREMLASMLCHAPTVGIQRELLYPDWVKQGDEKGDEHADTDGE